MACLQLRRASAARRPGRHEVREVEGYGLMSLRLGVCVSQVSLNPKLKP